MPTAANNAPAITSEGFEAPVRRSPMIARLGFGVSCAMLVAMLWLVGQFMKHRPQDLLSDTVDIGNVAADVLKYQGLPAESIEISAPHLQREPGAHYYRTKVSAHLPDSLKPEQAVSAIERALWPKRIIISAEDEADAERSETLTLDGHTVGELVLYHSPARQALRASAPAEDKTKRVAPQRESKPKTDAQAAPEPESKLQPKPDPTPEPTSAQAPPLLPIPAQQQESWVIPSGLWAPALGPIIAGGREKVAMALARLAIIVDDGGYGGEPAKIILALDRGLTFSILPNTPHCKSLAQEAVRLGFEVMLHMPMENTSPTLVHPGQIDARMDAAQIRRLTNDALGQVPGAKGINNHTGSKFTADSHAMGRFMEGLKGSGLYFVDSRTCQDSVAYEVARQFHIPAAARTLFLDDDHDTQTIRARFNELIADAKTQGSAIGICHFRPATAEILREMIPTLSAEGVTLVHVSELVR